MRRTYGPSLTRRTALAAGACLFGGPALSQPLCELGLPNHVKGPAVWQDLDQDELDAAYNQEFYQPHMHAINSRLSGLSFDLRMRHGYPERVAYGESPAEAMDIYKAPEAGGPVFVFIHGGIWLYLNAGYAGFAAEMFLDRKAHFVALDFAPVNELGGDLRRQANQVRQGIAWVVRNAESFGGDPARVYIGGHSSGGHLAAVALTTDWAGEFGLPIDAVKGGLCMSGMYDLAPVRLSWRSAYIDFTDEMEDAMSPQRHLDRVTAPVVVSYGTLETPEFQRQAKDFAAALDAAGKPVQLVVAREYFHQDMWETLGNPYGPNGRAALAMMDLGP
ncbi:alpha/beta hydrolase (plasmid) [Paracoccus liaowanqingii]|uniref:Alpha/beta hydrolase n=1 Tax=Paracoccus liaowanqingii TaxID=2560053 RepID=A0A4Y5SQX0_9RHOB|nr:alpha/beta hydrolase [Paracoccus liaowanqingii]QDA35887.1 alpha/beta hydrolase [Paracoccus liaowanqingii]